MIVQAPLAWKQHIQASLPNSLYRVIWDESNASKIVQRTDYLLAETTLALSAEAAHESNSTGFALVVTENYSVSLGIHRAEHTELHLWQLQSPQEAGDHLRSLLEQGETQQLLFDAALSHQVGIADLFDTPEESNMVWKFAEQRRFRPVVHQSAGGLLCGSFNPLHSGHQRMKTAAEEILEQPVLYEMTLRNADKPPLDYLSLSARAGQFSAGELLLTSVPTFGEKAELFPQSTFVIGWDTAIRVLDRRFYPDGELESALENFAERECRFLVATRRSQGKLQRLRDLEIPPMFRELFVEIPPELFEEDISSTAIRDAWLRGDSELSPPLHTLLNIPHND